jgi:Uma2 family endonuclease
MRDGWSPSSCGRTSARYRLLERHRHDAPVGYAEADIPVYLLIDRDNNTVTVFSEPKDGRYQQAPSYSWGSTIELPDPVNITLKTEKLKDYAD